ncbi:MAG TPA: VOC family protein, partial [Steroidobacteraceae bacterium]|nr:VOC family protein [Steroidobacteraceae bacterium]
MNRFVSKTLAAIVVGAALGMTASIAVAQQPKPTAEPKKAPAPHTIGSAKLIIADVKQSQTFFETAFGMKEVGHYNSKEVYDEPIMGFDSGARLALFGALAEKPIKKSQYPVALIYVPNLDAVVKRLEDAKYTVNRLPAAQSSTFKIAIAREPSGNAIEILERPGTKMEVGGSKIIVDDRQKAEDFFLRIFGSGIKSGQRYQTAAYDEVLMNFGEGAWLALFQPKSEAPLPKSQYPVVAIYTSDFDAVKKRVEEAGLGFRPVKSSTLGRIIIA